MDEDTLSAFFFGVVSGAAIVALVMMAAITPPHTIVKQGWIDYEGKVYRVVPAEVKANVQ